MNHLSKLTAAFSLAVPLWAMPAAVQAQQQPKPRDLLVTTTPTPFVTRGGVFLATILENGSCVQFYHNIKAGTSEPRTLLGNYISSLLNGHFKETLTLFGIDQQDIQNALNNLPQFDMMQVQIEVRSEDPEKNGKLVTGWVSAYGMQTLENPNENDCSAKVQDLLTTINPVLEKLMTPK